MNGFIAILLCRHCYGCCPFRLLCENILRHNFEIIWMFLLPFCSLWKLWQLTYDAQGWFPREHLLTFYIMQWYLQIFVQCVVYFSIRADCREWMWTQDTFHMPFTFAVLLIIHMLFCKYPEWEWQLYTWDKSKAIKISIRLSLSYTHQPFYLTNPFEKMENILAIPFSDGIYNIDAFQKGNRWRGGN